MQLLLPPGGLRSPLLLLCTLVQDSAVIAEGQGVLEPARAEELVRQAEHHASERQCHDPRVHVAVGALLLDGVHQRPVHVQLLSAVELLESFVLMRRQTTINRPLVAHRDAGKAGGGKGEGSDG